MPKPGLRKIYRCSDEFRVTAVKLSSSTDVLIQDVAHELDIHPFMLSRWRKEYREGRIVSRKNKVEVDPETAVELKRLRALKREYARLKEEHELLKKVIWFSSEKRQKSSSSSSNSEGNSE